MLYNVNRLVGVDKRLVSVVEAAALNIPFDVLVVEGVRTKERQAALYAQGRTKPGRIVTWTLKSKHIDGLAVDLAPYIDRKIAWEDELLFAVIGQEMIDAAKKLGVRIRWGWDWNMNGVLKERGETDGPHFELV